MTTRKDILDYVTTHPGCECNDASKALGMTPPHMATRLKQLIDGGFLTRKEARRLPTKMPVYAYWVNGAVTPTMNKKERVKTTMGERSDNAMSNPDISTLIQSIGEVLAKQIAAQVAVSLQPMLQRELVAVIPSTQVVTPSPVDIKALLQAPPHQPEQLEHKPKLPRVGVTGLLPQQAGLIQQEFCDTFDLTFWNDRNGDGQGSLKAMGIGCEVVFHHIQHASHSTESALRSVGAKIVKVNGGMSSMRDALTKYYVETARD